MTSESTIIAIYASHTAAESAIRELQLAQFEMKTISVMGRDFLQDEGAVGFYNTNQEMKVLGKTGAYWGGLYGFLIGSALFLVPGLGPLLVAGPLVGSILGALEVPFVLGGLTALGGGLFRIGVPQERIDQYELALKSGKYVLCVNGTFDETRRAEERLSLTAPEQLEHYPLTPAS